MNRFLLIACLLTLNLFSQQKVKVDLSSPHATIYTHLHFLQSNSYDAVKSSKTIYGEKEKKAKEIAIKIKEVLDGKGLLVDVKSLPTNKNYLDTISQFESTHRYVLFPNQLPQVYLEKINNKWYYSRETNQKIAAIYREVYPVETEFLRNLVPTIGHKKVFGIKVWQYVGVLLLVVLCGLLVWLLNKLVFFILKRVEGSLMKVSHANLNEPLYKLSRPSAVLIVFYLLEKYIPALHFNINVNSFLMKGVEVAQTFLWIYVVLQIVHIVTVIYTSYAEKTESKLDDQLVPILNRLLKVVVIIGGALKMLTVFGVDTNTVIAGASIGGLAVALASQDTVKNLIGTFMIFIDKPFQIGDWIVGGGVEGTVEEVGFRSSRIRAVDTSIFTIPNSMLAEIVINNLGLRKYRRYKTTLGVRYDTPPELIQAFVDGIRKLIEVHPATLTDSYNVELTGFGASSLDILVNTYFLSLSWDDEQTSKHTLHMAILKLATELGVDFAFPSQTLMVEQFPDKTTFDMKYDVSKERIAAIVAGTKNYNFSN